MLREMSVTVAVLFITSGVLVNAQKSGPAGGKETAVSVGTGGPLTVECPLRVEQRAEWRLNGSAVPADMRPAGEQAAGEGRLTARLHAAQARAQHAGLYTCGRGPDAHRVRVRVTPAQPRPAAPVQPSAAAAVAAAAPAPAGAAEDAAGIVEVDAPRVYYDINRNLSLHCSIPSSDKTQSYVWKKNKLVLDETPELKDRYTLEEGGAVFKVKGKANEEDYGSYSCELGEELRAWEVHGRPIARLPDNTNVVEGQNIKLQCKVLGKPTPRVWWTYSADLPAEGAADNASAALAPSAHISFAPNEQGVENATLLLEAAQRADAGVYVCHAGALGASDHTTLRVKDMYAALWPFLGICAEVFVLCAIILVYEKRRTKPELDDSDTDNHDQKKS